MGWSVANTLFESDRADTKSLDLRHVTGGWCVTFRDIWDIRRGGEARMADQGKLHKPSVHREPAWE